MTNAADRVEAYLDMRSRLPGVHPDMITGVGHEGGIAPLLADDLCDLIAIARRFGDVDTLAAEIRRVDGDHTLGAGALAEALLA